MNTQFKNGDRAFDFIDKWYPKETGNKVALTFFFPSLSTTPSISELDEQDGAFNLDRRSSVGTMLSPEVDLTSSTTKTAAGADSSELGGFYLLKKDSQRRATLFKVLTDDESKICGIWMDKIQTDRTVVISMVGDFLRKIKNTK